jgi:uncharacterized protein YggE
VRHIVVVASLLFIPVTSFAQSNDKIITVTGEATIAVTPDLAMIRGGVTSQGRTAQEASDANSRDMQAVIAALKQSGIEDRDIQTARLSINPLREATSSNRGRITSFQAVNQVTVRLRDVAKVAAVLDRMIGAGANDISGIEFSVSEPSKMLDQARKQAVIDARRKAEIYADAAGVRLGRAVAIQEEGAPAAYVARAPMLKAAAAMPIAVGEESLRTSVTIAYELMH